MLPLSMLERERESTEKLRREREKLAVIRDIFL
jgi:hypothetical protein